MRPTIGWLTAGLLISVSGWASTITLGTFAVNPQSTFLYQTSNDNNVAALFISLTGCTGSNAPCVSAPAGTTIQVIALGNLCYFSGTGCTEYPAALGGAFDSNNVLVSSASLTGGNVDRLTGTVNAPGTEDISHVSYFNTFFGNIDTTIPNDFVIPTGNGIAVVVPTGANYLVVGVMDSYYADNSDPLNNLGVQINEFVPAVSEPATLGLLATGLGAFAFLRRERRGISARKRAPNSIPSGR